MTSTPPPTLLALSGPSSSGKTTLARLLRQIFPENSVLILHEDDFYLPEEQLPMRAGHRDWDCAAALDIPGLISTLDHLKINGTLPTSLISKEDQNEAGYHGVPDAVLEELKGETRTWVEQLGKPISKLIIIDGFLLFGKSVTSTVGVKFDSKILLRVRYKDAKDRREARKGYVTLEGFWEDPAGYVDDVVWPGYMEEHGYLFKGGDVDGLVDEGVAKEVGVDLCPGNGEMSVQAMLAWLLGKVKGVLEAAA